MVEPKTADAVLPGAISRPTERSRIGRAGDCGRRRPRWSSCGHLSHRHAQRKSTDSSCLAHPGRLENGSQFVQRRGMLAPSTQVLLMSTNRSQSIYPLRAHMVSSLFSSAAVNGKFCRIGVMLVANRSQVEVNTARTRNESSIVYEAN